MTIERLEELKGLLIWMTGAPDIKFTQDQAELFSDGLQIIDSAIEMLKKEKPPAGLY